MKMAISFTWNIRFFVTILETCYWDRATSIYIDFYTSQSCYITCSFICVFFCSVLSVGTIVPCLILYSQIRGHISRRKCEGIHDFCEDPIPRCEDAISEFLPFPVMNLDNIL